VEASDAAWGVATMAANARARVVGEPS
jgi:hypothetical protein